MSSIDWHVVLSNLFTEAAVDTFYETIYEIIRNRVTRKSSKFSCMVFTEFIYLIIKTKPRLNGKNIVICQIVKIFLCTAFELK